jgi:hypothetical protein
MNKEKKRVLHGFYDYDNKVKSKNSNLVYNKDNNHTIYAIIHHCLNKVHDNTM